MLQLGEVVKLRNCRLVHEKNDKTNATCIGIEMVGTGQHHKYLGESGHAGYHCCHQ